MGRGVYDGWSGLEWSTTNKGTRRAKGMGPDEKGMWVGEVRELKGGKWEAEILTPDQETLAKKTCPTAFSGELFVERTLSVHGFSVPEAYGNYVLRQREMLGLTQNQFAKLCEVNATTIRDIELNGLQPTVGTRGRIYEGINKALDERSSLEVEIAVLDRVALLEERVAALEAKWTQ